MDLGHNLVRQGHLSSDDAYGTQKYPRIKVFLTEQGFWMSLIRAALCRKRSKVLFKDSWSQSQ